MIWQNMYFSPEYDATCIWSSNRAAFDRFGSGGIDYDALQLSAELVKKLEKFDRRCLDIIDWSDPGAGDIRPKDEQEAYLMTGLRLLEMVRAELGGEYEVLDGLDWIRPHDENGNVIRE